MWPIYTSFRAVAVTVAGFEVAERHHEVIFGELTDSLAQFGF